MQTTMDIDIYIDMLTCYLHMKQLEAESEDDEKEGNNA